MEKEIVMTYAGLRALEDELEQLKTVKRKEVAEKIKVARGYGDLSENSEYDEAKNEQGLVEGRIALLEKMLKHARVVTEDELSTDHISVGSHVRIKDEDGDEDEYDITGSTEADPVNGKISDESPIGAALIGHSVGSDGDRPSRAVSRTKSGFFQKQVRKHLFLCYILCYTGWDKLRDVGGQAWQTKRWNSWAMRWRQPSRRSGP